MLLGPEGLDHDRHRPGHADRVGHLDLGPLGQPRRDQVLGHVASRIGGRAVDLGGVLAREGAAAVTGHAAVGVDDDLAPGQPAVAHRAADHEPTGGVDQEAAVQLALVVQVGRDDRGDHVLPQVLANVGLRALFVLGRDQQLLDADRPAVDIADADLGLAVGAQIGQCLVLADLGQAPGQPVGQGDRQRHQLRGLVGGVAEHHPLVAGPGQIELVVAAGAGAGLKRLVDALGDVRRLLVDRVDDRAGLVVKAHVGVRVADPLDRRAGHLLDVHVGLGGYLARDHDQAGVHERLAGHPPRGIVAQDGVEHAVGDLVGDLVGMALRDRLRGEKKLVLSGIHLGVSTFSLNFK